MNRWRYAVLASLFSIPILILIGLGMFYLWQSGLAFWMWWPLTGCFAAAYILGWRWQKQQRLLTNESPAALHWTERDHAAWRLVEAKAEEVKKFKPDQFTDIPTFVQTAQELALDLARFYHPKSKDPAAALTIPEILAVVELASHDLGQMVDQYLPGGHLLTINDLRRVKTMADWYPTISNITWLLSGVFAPLNTATRYLASRAGMSLPWQMLQENVLIWFFTAYVHRLGGYLIELNSGRLRVGAPRYMQLQKANGPATSATPADPADAVRTVSFVVMGQVKAGKSSLINALLGEQRAVADVVPTTSSITRYELQHTGVPTRLHLLDTVGYGHAGPTADQLKTTEEAACGCDLIFLVVHARNPARQADVDMLKALSDYFERRPELRKPPILAVMTHIDLLSPSLEWQPPYDWQKPQRTKEHQIAEAVATVHEQLPFSLIQVVPVCAAPGKILGIDEWLLPAMMGLLDQAHAVAFLRCLKAEADAGKVRRVFNQLLAISKSLASAFLAQPPAR